MNNHNNHNPRMGLAPSSVEIPLHSEPYEINHQESAGMYRETNLMFSRGIINVMPDGRRLINTGKGFIYNIPEPQCNIVSCIHTVNERRNPEIYSYTVETLEEENGKCNVCSAITSYRCQKCSTFYCSRQCQSKDWPIHKTQCEQLPSLIKIKKESSQKSHMNSIQNESYETDNQLRRPKCIEMPHNSQITNNHQQNIQYPRNTDSRYQNKEPLKPTHPEVQQNIQSNKNTDLRYQTSESLKPTHPQVNNQSTVNLDSKYQNGESSKPAHENKLTLNKKQDTVNKNHSNEFKEIPKVSQSSKAKSCGNKSVDQNLIILDDCDNSKSKNKLVEMDETIVFADNTYLSKETYTKVIIQSNLNNGIYYIQKFEDDKLIQDISAQLAVVGSQNPLIKPELNLKCGAYLEGIWYRAIITSLSPIKYLLIDYGDEIGYPDVKFCSLDKLNDYPHMARKIVITNQNISKYLNFDSNQAIWVKALSYNSDGSINVEVNDEKSFKPELCGTENIIEKISDIQISESSSSQSSPINIINNNDVILENIAKMPSVLNRCSIGSYGIIAVHAELSSNSFSINLIPESEIDNLELLIEKFLMDCSEKTPNPNYKPKIGELVCAKLNENEWFRGFVLKNSTPMEVAIIDECRFANAISALPITEDYAKICSFGLILKFPRSGIKYTSDWTFKVTEVGIESAKIEVFSDKKFLSDAEVMLWKPSLEEKKTFNFELKNGSEVAITHFIDQSLLYVCSVDISEKKITDELQKKIAKCIQPGNKIKKAPTIGEMYAVPYIDENYYRGIVMNIKNNSVTIKYIDFGNEDPCSVDKLYDLPNDIKLEAPRAAKVSLKDVPKSLPFSKDANEYFQCLINEAIPLTCNFNGDPLKDGVNLTKANNESVNDSLLKLLAPEEKQEVKKTFVSEDLPSLKLGKVGDTVTLILLGMLKPYEAYIMCPYNQEAISEIQEIMPTQIMEYVNKTKEHYVPKDNEICIAKYLDSYYRGFCLTSMYIPEESQTNSKNTSDESQILFVDYGNIEIVKHTNIRAMTEEFMKHERLTTLCLIDFIPEEKRGNKKLTERMDQLMQVNETILVKITKELEDGAFQVEMPEIHKKLLSENLL